jgi:hypothetical protein
MAFAFPKDIRFWGHQRMYGLLRRISVLHDAICKVLSLFLSPFCLAVRPKVGLVLKGKVDEVRKAARHARFLPINGVEIIGYGEPVDPCCAFLEELTTIQFARLYAYHLMHLESIGSMAQLRHLQIDAVPRGRVIAVDLAKLRNLERAALQWFTGAETIFGAKQLRNLTLTYCPMLDSQPLGELKSLLRLRLLSGRLREVGALRQLSSLRWLALHDHRKLADFTGLADHPAIQFLWIEGCRKLDSFQWLTGMPRLETLRILDCGRINGIEVLQSLPRLKHVHIHGDVKIPASDFSFFRRMPGLESVFIRGMPRTEADYWARRKADYSLIRQDLPG